MDVAAKIDNHDGVFGRIIAAKLASIGLEQVIDPSGRDSHRSLS